MDTSEPRIVIVAALEREVSPFIKNWRARRREHEGRTFRFYEKENAVVVCGGIGSEAARRAAEAAIHLYCPSLVISAGFAGALDPDLQVGHTVTPRHVIDAGDGSRRDLGAGEGMLISFATVADVEQKAQLAKSFGAHAVDMEAAAVARAAEARGVPFLACKVISDTSDAGLPPLASFIGQDGRFQTMKYMAHVAIRPWLWARVVRLARDTARAAQSLSGCLQKHKDAATAAKLVEPSSLKEA